MLVLFETPAGYALFKVLDKGKLKDVENLWKAFESPETAQQVVKLKAFAKFEDTTKALAAAAAICEGKLDKGLRKFLKNSIVAQNLKSRLAVADGKLGGLIKSKLGIKCVSDNVIHELLRGIRQQMDVLLTGISREDSEAMRLGLSHSLSRYKLKFSPDKVDTMIIQAISLLDELDKELNTYAMRVREWYGWHFPEMGKIVLDNNMYAKVVKKMGIRTKCKETDFSEILPEEVEEALKEAAEVSMGTEIAPEDVDNIQQLCDQVINIGTYRASLFDYLKNRMSAIAPNLSVMVGELVGARLIAHAGSLLNLAKQPASTVQILGAEKALFRALKTKKDTPKYGLIYHASLVGQATPKHKGKISRVLAAKAALATRADALGDVEGVTIGLEAREKVESRLRQLEGGQVHQLSGTGKGHAAEQKYEKKDASAAYNPAADVAMEVEKKKKKKKDKKKEEIKVKVEVVVEAPTAAAVTTSATSSDQSEGKQKEKDKKKKRKRYFDGKAEGAATESTPTPTPTPPPAPAEQEKSKKKKKKQKRTE